ncbi:hypothetical protein ACLQ3B_25105 [Micromonospora sp. DT53]|uniref:hypothetical protein n=1 Tax=Micromonospora sp. DT53 TaxID=3393444 RepID=UPI003CF1DAD4
MALSLPLTLGGLALATPEPALAAPVAKPTAGDQLTDRCDVCSGVGSRARADHHPILSNLTTFSLGVERNS